MTTFTDVAIPSNILRDPVKFSEYVRNMQEGAAMADKFIHPYTPMPYEGDLSKITLDSARQTADWINDNIQIISETALITIDETNKRIYLK